MDIGVDTAILLSATMGAVSFIIKDIFNNLVSGLWIRYAGEVIPGDEITIKTEFQTKTGTVKDVHIRNVVIELESGKDLLVEATKIFKEDVIRERDND